VVGCTDTTSPSCLPKALCTEKTKSWQQHSAQIGMYRNLTSRVSAWGELQPNASWVRKSIHIAAPNVSGAETQQGCSSQRVLLHHVPSELSISWKLNFFSRNLPFNKEQQREKFLNNERFKLIKPQKGKGRCTKQASGNYRPWRDKLVQDKRKEE